MELHDNIKTFLLGKLKSEVSSVAFTTELTLDNNRLDIANRNLKWIVEVEPTAKEREDGRKQLLEYVKQIEEQGIKGICAILCYHKTVKTKSDYFGGDPKELEFLLLEGDSLRTIDWQDFIELAKKSLQERIPLEGRTFVGLFRSSKEEFYEKLRATFDGYFEKISPLYKVYEEELKKIYPDASEDKLRELYVLHTILNAVAVCLVNTVIHPHRNVEERFIHRKGFSLPFLNWWLVLYRQGFLSQEDKEVVRQFMESVANVIDSFDWSNGKQKDIFRLLYEEYVSEEDRRKIGEYYTPTWFVRWCLDTAGQEWLSMPVLDPCCGTGTFLDEALRRKIDSGTDPDEALSSVIGFDINPLAVVLARAELFLTYREKGGKAETVPLVFYGDSSLWYGDRIELLKSEGDKRDEYVYARNLVSKSRIGFKRLPALENELELLFENVEKEIAKEDPQKRISVAYGLILEGLKEIFKHTPLKDADMEKLFNIYRIANEINDYGNGIWAVAVVSAIAKYSIENDFSKKFFVATNPPWIVLTRIKGAYGKLIRKILKTYGAKGQEITGGDISSLFICRYGEKSGVFVMPRYVVYSGSYGMGANITLRCLERKPHTCYLFSYDVFEHGILPAVVVIGKGDGKVYDVKLRRAYKKSDEHYSLEDFELIAKDRESYEIAKQAYSLQLGITKVATKVRTNGTYIRGLKGGELKRGARKYAGLILEEYSENTGEGKFANMREKLVLGMNFKQDWVKKVIYMDRVLPFKLLAPYDATLSDKGEEKLKTLIRDLADRAKNEEDKQLLLELAKEVRQAIPEYLRKGMFYLVHRVDRIFSAVVINPDQDNLYVVDSTLCVVEFDKPEPAYYYCGLANYLIEKVQKGFHRHIHSRVLRAFDLLDIHWQRLDWQIKVAELSKVLHDLMKERNVEDNKEALEALRQMDEYKELMQVIDANVDKDKLNRAIKLLSSQDG